MAKSGSLEDRKSNCGVVAQALDVIVVDYPWRRRHKGGNSIFQASNLEDGKIDMHAIR